MRHFFKFIHTHIQFLGLLGLFSSVIVISLYALGMNPLYKLASFTGLNLAVKVAPSPTPKFIRCDVGGMVLTATEETCQDLDNQLELDGSIPTSSPLPENDYVNSDPIVSCGPGEQSGQYVKDKQSNCKYYVDCGLNNNSVWTMILKSECDAKHAGQNTNNDLTQQTGNSTNKVPVFIPFLGYTLECPSQNVQAVNGINTTIESKKIQWAKDYNACSNNFINTDSCQVDCGKSLSNDEKLCANLHGSDWDSCIKQATDNLQSCQSKCPNSSSVCNNPESTILIQQIRDLCR